MGLGVRSSRIDVLRGLSIVLVLLHHFNIAYTLKDTALSGLFGWPVVHAICRNGNYAVTMFFVVSGFLITSNAERRWGGLSRVRIATFYRFRAARILPCLLLLLILVNALAAMRIGIFENTPEFGGPVPFWIVDLASLTFWMNVLMGHSGWLNYVLCVQWSLSIEEVFYLWFPLLCLFLRRDVLLLLAWGVFILIGPIWRAAHHGSEYLELNAYLSCFDGIAFGCCAAVMGKHIQISTRSARLIGLVAAFAMTWFYLSNSIAVTAVYGVSLMAFGTAVLVLAQARDGRSDAAGSLNPLRFCGALSYELYLFHLVVLGGLRSLWAPAATTGNVKLVLLLAYLVLAIVVAVGISRYFSEPLNRRLRHGSLFGAGLTVAG